MDIIAAMMDKESRFISHFSKKSSYIGDDGAVVGKMVYSKDLLLEGVHFKLEWLSLKEVATRAVAVNVSDAIAMNATPKQLLLGIGVPSSFSTKEMEELSLAFVDVCDSFGIEIIGGDTVSSDRLNISITLISTAKKPLYRYGLKRGDLLAFTGKIGGARKELRYLLSGGKLHKTSHFNSIKLRKRFVELSSKALRVGMDISDGLGSDLQKLSWLNRVGFRFKKRISKMQLCSGEEYEMLVGFAPKERKRVLRIAKSCRTPITLFAKASRKTYTNSCKAHHF